MCIRDSSGGTIESALVTIQAMGADAFGLNCSAGPSTMLENIRKLSGYAKVPLIAKPNAGLPKVMNGKTFLDLTPSEFCQHLPEFYAAGVRIFGGCCGTDDRHITAMHRMLPLLQQSEGIMYSNEEYLASEREILAIDKLSDVVEVDCDEDLMDSLLDAEGKPVCVNIVTEQDLKNLSENIHAARGIIGFKCDDNELLSKALMLYNGRAFVEGEAEPDPEFGAIKL